MLSRFAITTYKKTDLTSTIIFGLLFPSIKFMKSSVLFFHQTPVHTIAANAGVEGAVVVGKLLEQDNPDLGYDAAKGLLLTLSCYLLFFSLYPYHESLFLIVSVLKY